MSNLYFIFSYFATALDKWVIDYNTDYPHPSLNRKKRPVNLKEYILKNSLNFLLLDKGALLYNAVFDIFLHLTQLYLCLVCGSIEVLLLCLYYNLKRKG